MAAMTRRWLIVLLAAVALVATPLLVSARPAQSSDLTADVLATRIQASGGVGWSGYAQSSGAVQIPDSDSFASLAQLLGEDNNLRVWWRTATDWRVDRIRSTGETDLFRQASTTVRWVFESEAATVSPVSTVRLPDVSDLLPPTLGRSMLQGVRADELSRLPSRRIAGIDAPGLRLVPNSAEATVAAVDIWADADTGLTLRVDVYGPDDVRPVVTTALRDVDLTAPDASTTAFVAGDGIDLEYEDSVDVAADANALSEYDLPASLAGLGTRTGADPGAVGVYGRGPTTLIVLPLRGQVAGPVRQQLRLSAGARETAVGTVATVGPIGLLVTPRRLDPTGRGSAFVLAGTVSPETLGRAATELLATL